MIIFDGHWHAALVVSNSMTFLVSNQLLDTAFYVPALIRSGRCNHLFRASSCWSSNPSDQVAGDATNDVALPGGNSPGLGVVVHHLRDD